MVKHSQHSNDRSFFTYKERVNAGFAGTRKEVLGTDCFLPFGYCALSLKPPKNPVSTPEGYIYDKEHILEYLANQKLELQSQQKKYDDQEHNKALKQQSAERQERLKEIVDFQQVDQGIFSQDYSHKRALERADATVPGADDRPEKKLREGELLVIDKAEMRKKNFWAASVTPTAAPAEMKKVDTASRCPMSGSKLKLKDLVSLKLEATDQKMLDGGGGRGVFCCAVSKHPITHQQAVVLKPSGVVVLESVLKDCVLKDMQCPVTGKKLKGKEDILKLQMGNSGFSAHNDIEAKSFSHIRSHAADCRRARSGHLPSAGFAGLR